MGDDASADPARISAARAALAAHGIDAKRLGIAADRLAARIVALDAVESPHLPDVALAFACAEQSPVALGELQARHGGEFAGALSRLSFGRAEIDEVAQTVRERLFVSHGDVPPKILDYAGRGSLAGWLRAVIVRAGIDFRRRRALDHELSPDGEPLVDLDAKTDDPELESLRARYAEPFRLAFRDAVRALPQDERNALRLNVAEGLNIEQIGNLYGVHRATVARWIARAREGIAENTRRLLAERLGMPAKDVESLVRLCQSRLDVGFSVLGATEVGPAPGDPSPGERQSR
jgi:RNA polymerase sigma-70 factor (ECF subfamily)